LQALHFHYEAGEMSRFVSNTTAQVEVAAGFTLAELRGAVNAIADSFAPIPPKPSGENALARGRRGRPLPRNQYRSTCPAPLP
jgi:hypothetical protein